MRGVVEAIGDASSTSLSSLRARLPERLAVICADLLNGSASGQLILALGDAEALLFELDSLSGLPPGQALEAAGRAYALRTIAKSGHFGPGATDAERLRQLGDALTGEFVGGPLKKEIDSGGTNKVALSLTIFGRPRMARVLRHFGEGVARAALRRAGGETPTITGSVSSDRATVEVSYDRSAPAPTAPEPKPPPPRRGSSTTVPSTTKGRAPAQGLSKQIEAILSTRTPPLRPEPDEE